MFYQLSLKLATKNSIELIRNTERRYEGKTHVLLLNEIFTKLTVLSNYFTKTSINSEIFKLIIKTFKYQLIQKLI